MRTETLNSWRIGRPFGVDASLVSVPEDSQETMETVEPGFDDSGMDSVLFFAMIDVWATVALGRRHLICSRQHRQEFLRHR